MTTLRPKPSSTNLILPRVAHLFRFFFSSLHNWVAHRFLRKRRVLCGVKQKRGVPMSCHSANHTRRRAQRSKQGVAGRAGSALLACQPTKCRPFQGKGQPFKATQRKTSEPIPLCRRPAVQRSEARNAQYFIYCNLSGIRTRPWLWPVVFLADYSLPQGRTAAAELPQ